MATARLKPAPSTPKSFLGRRFGRLDALDPRNVTLRMLLGDFAAGGIEWWQARDVDRVAVPRDEHGVV